MLASASPSGMVGTTTLLGTLLCILSQERLQALKPWLQIILCPLKLSVSPDVTTVIQREVTQVHSRQKGPGPENIWLQCSMGWEKKTFINNSNDNKNGGNDLLRNDNHGLAFNFHIILIKCPKQKKINVMQETCKYSLYTLKQSVHYPWYPTLSPNKYKMHTQRDESVGKWDRNLYLKDPPKTWLGMTAHL